MTCNPSASKVSWLKEPLLVSKKPKEAEFARFVLSSCDQFAEILRSRITIKEVGRNGNIPGLLSAVPVEYCPLGVAGIYQLGRLRSVRSSQDLAIFTRQYLKEMVNPVVLVETGFAGNWLLSKFFTRISSTMGRVLTLFAWKVLERSIPDMALFNTGLANVFTGVSL